MRRDHVASTSTRHFGTKCQLGYGIKSINPDEAAQNNLFSYFDLHCLPSILDRAWKNHLFLFSIFADVILLSAVF